MLQNLIKYTGFFLCCLLATNGYSMVVNVAGPYNPKQKQPVIFYAPAHPDFLFDHGKFVEIWLQPINRPISLKWQLCRNRVNTPFLTGTCNSEFDESFKIEIPTAQLLPAFYDLHVQISFSDKDKLDATTVFGWKATDEALVPVVPANFRAFWNETKKKIDGIPLDLKITPIKTVKGNEIGDYNITSASLPEHYDPDGELYQEVEVYKVSFAASGGLRTYGWFTKPPGDGPFPTLLILPGAGNGPRPIPLEHARHGYAALDINLHNCDVDLPKGEYPRPPETHDFAGIKPEEDCDYQLYCNALGAVNALRSLPYVDSSRLAVLGGSQGGRTSAFVASMDSQIKAAILAIAHFGYVPWRAWVEQLNQTKDAGNRPFSPSDIVTNDKLKIESYYDVMNFSPSIRCPVLMNAGLTDPVSPPTSVLAIFRSINSEKKLIPLPNLAHDWSPAFDRYAWKWLSKQLNTEDP